MPENAAVTSPGRALAAAMRRHLFYSQAKISCLATRHDYYRALALAVRAAGNAAAGIISAEGIRVASFPKWLTPRARIFKPRSLQPA